MKIIEISKIKPKALSINEAARYIGLSPKTLRNRLGRKAENPFPVKPKRHGRKLFFMLSDLDAFLEGLPYENYE